jgi:hypothetical protein
MKMKQILPLMSALFLAGNLTAQVNLSSLPYSQTFNVAGLTGSSGSWADNSTLTGWYAANTNGTAGTFTPYTTWSATAGGGTASGTFYTMGTSSTAADRAIGGAPSTTAGWTVLGLRLLNDTGSVFDDLKVSYDLEQWSDRGTATITLSYQIFDAGSGSLSTLTGWNEFSTATSPLPINPGPTFNNGIGNTTGLLPGVIGGVGSLGLQDGDELWLRWEITKVGGQNATHGIDNVIVQVPEPSVFTLLLLGALGLAGGWRWPGRQV